MYQRLHDRLRQPAPPPVTYYIDPEFAKAELAYADMLALSGLFRRWALYEDGLDPSTCTRLICWSADYEDIAEWVGSDWVASDPSGTLTYFITNLERRYSKVIDAKQLFLAQPTKSGQ